MHRSIKSTNIYTYLWALGPGSSRVYVAVGALCCGMVAFSFWVQIQWTASRATSNGVARPNEPLRIQPLVPASLDVSLEGWEWSRRQMQPLEQVRSSVSLGLHLLRVHGREGRFSDPVFSSGDAIIKLLTDQKARTDYFGHLALIRSRHGVRFPTNPLDPPRPLAGESERDVHRDQCLSAFGEPGIPLSFPPTVDAKPHELRNVLRDSIANSDLAQRELSWTAMAYIPYLPPEKTWI